MNKFVLVALLGVLISSCNARHENGSLSGFLNHLFHGGKRPTATSTTTPSSLLTSSVTLQEINPIVNTSIGPVRGESGQISRDGNSYIKFTGIPYGTFDRRFECSKSPEPWTNVFNATQPGPDCYQRTYSGVIEGDENCLNLNVFTTKLPSNVTTLRPVIVWIHGGGFAAGSGGMYGPDYLMDEDVVVVSINYRLGAFGWFNMGIKGAGGNQGAKDVILGLKWIQDNIASFNGNPNLVTLVGESAGGVQVSGIYHSPLAVGLFHRVITQSGPSVAALAVNSRPQYFAQRVAINAGCAVEGGQYNATQVLSCLQGVSRETILNAINSLNSSWYNEEDDSEHQYNFSIDDGIEGEEAFLPASPSELLAAGNYNTSVPMMIGALALDAVPFTIPIMSNPRYVESLNTEFKRVSPIVFEYYNYSTRDNVSAALKEFYFGSDYVFQNNLETNDIMAQIMLDRRFLTSSRKYANLLTTAVNGSAYLYMFDKKMRTKSPYQSPVHAEELNYLFNVQGSPPQFRIDSNSTDYQFSKNMIKLWVSFAIEGKPNYTWGNNSEPWTAFNPAEQPPKWYHIDDNTLQHVSESRSVTLRMEFWANIDQAELNA